MQFHIATMTQSLESILTEYKRGNTVGTMFLLKESIITSNCYDSSKFFKAMMLFYGIHAK